MKYPINEDDFLLGLRGGSLMTKENALWHIENLPEGADVKVHYLYTDEDLTIREICDTYSEDNQFHFIVAVKRRHPWHGKLS